MSLKKIISGGQTGADQGGLLAAKAFGIETGGHAPQGFRTLNGSDLKLRDIFGLEEHSEYSYKGRTWANVENSHGTLRFAKDFQSAGEKCTLWALQKYKRPYFDIDDREMDRAESNGHPVEEWIKYNNIEVLNIAGNSHYTWGKAEEYTFIYLGLLFKKMGFDRVVEGKTYREIRNNILGA